MVDEYTRVTKNHVVLIENKKKDKNSKQDQGDALSMTSAQFQMQHAGHVMLRSMRSAKDERVKGFYPDGLAFFSLFLFFFGFCLLLVFVFCVLFFFLLLLALCLFSSDLNDAVRLVFPNIRC